ncbi:hypothetical protein LOTGIDRAFT_169984 [Lottia gigantea]|uniref:Protein quiver n=1 Tax=Lottia gigantea TaxID=225164 RepID=V3ZJ60_LOTGI|nr:hypothetical protein LOTGIDRAFT_169984 [Lottia gigantea]ESO82365.1 hypothetical protein LOTGIDRAFT_169984 [Lottia gigantea]
MAVNAQLVKKFRIQPITCPVDSIRCYICSNTNNLACGLDFKTYQFKTEDCIDPNAKCGKQTQMPLEGDVSTHGWVGVLRSCYLPGSLPGINETNGCHMWTNYDQNFTASYCFCDTDKCNSAYTFHSAPHFITFASVLSALILCMQ